MMKQQQKQTHAHGITKWTAWLLAAMLAASSGSVYAQDNVETPPAPDVEVSATEQTTPEVPIAPEVTTAPDATTAPEVPATPDGEVVPYTLNVPDNLIEPFANLNGNSQAKIDSIIKACVTADMNDYDKALAVYNYFALHFSYLYENSAEARNVDNLLNDNIRKGNCTAYSDAYNAVMEKLGIPSKRINSDAMMHTWNAVKINEKWYELDVTWSDPVPDRVGGVDHQYFLLTKAGMQGRNHSGGNHANVGVTSELTDTALDGAFFRRTVAASVYYKGWWYSVDAGYTNGKSQYGKIIKWQFNPTTGAITQSDFLELNHQWPMGAGYSTMSWAGLGLRGDTLYVSAPDSIYTIDLTSTTPTLVQRNKISTGKGYIYGMFVDGNTLSYTVGTSNNNTSAAANFDLAADTFSMKIAANGGTNAPAGGSKLPGTPYKLPTAIPTLEGYTFQGWSTVKNGAVEFAAGADYPYEQPTTFYAVWKKIQVASGEFQYEENEDGTITITGFAKVEAQSVTPFGTVPTGLVDGVLALPSTIDGLTVTGIGDYAFANNREIKEIVFPSTLKNIDQYAFSNCFNLKKADFPLSLKSIGEAAFLSCWNFVPTLHEGLESTGMMAFWFCGYNTTTTGVMRIPASLKDLGHYTFADMRAVSSFEVAEGNGVVTTDDAGVLYTSDYTTLLTFPAGSTRSVYNVRPETTMLYCRSFAGMRYLKQLYVPNSRVRGMGYTFDSTSLTLYGHKDAFLKDQIQGRAIATGAINWIDYTGNGILATGFDISGNNKVPATAQLKLTATVTPEDASDKYILWTSSDKTVATVDYTGVVTGVAVGTATITGKTRDGSDIVKTHEVTVVPATLKDINQADVDYSISVLENNIITVSMQTCNTEADVWKYLQEKLPTMLRSDVTFTPKAEPTFIAAIAGVLGSEATEAGTKGSYTRTIQLSKGTNTTDEGFAEGASVIGTGEATVTVIISPQAFEANPTVTIVAEPDTKVLEGNPITLSVEIKDILGPYTYEWYYDGPNKKLSYGGQKLWDASPEADSITLHPTEAAHPIMIGHDGSKVVQYQSGYYFVRVVGADKKRSFLSEGLKVRVNATQQELSTFAAAPAPLLDADDGRKENDPNPQTYRLTRSASGDLTLQARIAIYNNTETPLKNLNVVVAAYDKNDALLSSAPYVIKEVPGLKENGDSNPQFNTVYLTNCTEAVYYKIFTLKDKSMGQWALCATQII